MNGLQSLMQGAPTQRPQQPQPQQAPAMPNDPRMGAAMGLVDDSVEKFNLDPILPKKLWRYCNPQVDKPQWTKHRPNPLQ